MTRSVLLFSLLAAAVLAVATRAADSPADKPPRVFELRVYYAAPGKMKALHARFREHTCKLFEKHGMQLVGFWSPTDARQAEEKLIYLLAYPSREAAQKSWAGFSADPEWKAAREASEKDGSLVAKVESTYLNPTDYSAMK